MQHLSDHASPTAERVVRTGRSPWVHGSLAVVLWLAAAAASVGTIGAVVDDGAHHHGTMAVHGAGHPFDQRLVAWAVMTLAMMLPTAIPMSRALWTVLEVDVSKHPESSVGQRWWAFVVSYCVVWLGAAAVLAAAQLGLAAVDAPLSGPLSAAAGLLAAGAYQFSSLKMRCLTGCTRPMTFLLAHWREGISGAASLGMRHGLHCVGCCWVLMSVALIGGLHSLPVMAAVTIVMVVEKLPSVGETIRVPVGLLLVAAGGVTLVGALT